MKITKPQQIKAKSLVVFDLDGTLALTKTPMDREMAELLAQLLASKKVAVIGGGKYELFKTQFLAPLKIKKDLFRNLFLFPTTGTSFYRYDRGWRHVYRHELTKQEKVSIRKAFAEAFTKLNYQQPKKIYGELIEDRGTQMTFSALGQDVVEVLGKKKGVALKEQWKHDHTQTKLNIAKIVSKLLPNLEVRAAGHTSIDVTKKGIDKAYGIGQMEKYLRVKKSKMLFMGDAIFPGGNDYAVVRTGVDYIPVKDPEETKEWIVGLVE